MSDGKIKRPDQGSALHSGHRKRMRERALRDGTTSLADHELLEMLLYYVIPRGNTNEQAHELLHTYQNLQDLIDGDADMLRHVQGLGESSVVFFALLREMIRRYGRGDTQRRPVLRTQEDCGAYFINLLAQERVECLYMVCLDAQKRVIATVALARGNAESSTVQMSDLAEAAVRFRARRIILAHNHPGGVTTPSMEDLETTQRIREALRPLGIQVLDHYIVAGDKYLSLSAHGLM